MLTCKIDQNRIVGSSVIEVKAFPEYSFISNNSGEAFEKLNTIFGNLLSELHKFSEMNLSSLEMLWLGEKVENQFFCSRLRLFLILRIIGSSENQICKELQLNQNNIVSALNQAKMETVVHEKADSFIDLIQSVDFSHHFSMVKAENVYMDPVSGSSYYSWNILNNSSSDSMAALLASMSQLSRFAVSFQLIPTSCSQVDHIYLSNLKNIIQRGQDINDPHLLNALSTVQYVESHLSKPVFYYGISIFGSFDCCRTIAVKMSSLLNSGTKKISDSSVMTLDLSRERIQLDKHFFVYPWSINKLLLNKYRNPQFLQYPLIQILGKFPYLMSIEELQVFFRPPFYETSMPFLTEKKAHSEIEHFSDSVLSEKTIKVGKLHGGENSDIQIGIPYKVWTRHAVVVGSPGSGKTTFAVNILTQFNKANIPFLAIEPTKTEYRAMIDVIPDLQIFTPGLSNISPFVVNPFIPPVGVAIEQYIPSLMNAFKAAFAMDGPLEMLFLRAINDCYTEYGWKKNSKLNDPGTTVFGIYEYILCFKKTMKTMNYSKETHANIQTAGLLRLMNLIEQNPMIYDTVHTVPIEDLLSKPTVIELNAIANEEQKALVMALLLSNVFVYTTNIQKGDGNLQNVLLIDEAHVLLDSGADNENSGRSKEITVHTVQRMIAELRSYGTGIIIADQSPSAISKKVVSLSNIKVVFQLNSPEDCALIAGNANMSKTDEEAIPSLEIGQAFVSFQGLKLPHLIKTEDTRKSDGIRLNVDDEEVCRRSTYWKAKQKNLIPYTECQCSSVCKTCSFSCRNDADYFSSKCYEQTRSKITDKKVLLAYMAKIPNWLEKSGKNCNDSEFCRLCNCTMIQFVRKCKLNLPIDVSLRDLQSIINDISRKRGKSDV